MSGFAPAPPRHLGERPPKANGRPSPQGDGEPYTGPRARAFVLPAGVAPALAVAEEPRDEQELVRLVAWS
jgi:hypothetical protein